MIKQHVILLNDSRSINGRKSVTNGKTVLIRKNADVPKKNNDELQFDEIPFKFIISFVHGALVNANVSLLYLSFVKLQIFNTF